MAQRKRGGGRDGGMDGGSGGRSQRQLRVGEELRHVLADVFLNAHFRDPDLAGLSVTVSEVRVSPDLKAATAFIMPLAGRDATKAIAALNRAQAYIRTEAVRRINLRVAPTFTFKLDASFDEAERVSRLLRQPAVQADLVRPAGATETEE